MEHLYCPACKGEYLHHYQTEVFERPEDAEYGTHVSIMAGRYTTCWQLMDNSFANESASATVTINEEMKGNPSSRRQGIIVKFICEECSHISELQISQHKGWSLMRFA